MKVDFAGIGPGKSGTTWVYSVLSKHPQVSICRVKESNFFNDEYGRGFDWYHRLFDFTDSSKITGEVSNTYIFSPEAAERISRYSSDIKLFSILRDPLERAVSHYMFLIRNGAQFSSFSSAIESRPDLMSRGLYFSHLQPYLTLFSKDQLFIDVFENIKSEPQGLMNRLTMFLGIENIEIVQAQAEQFSASKPRSAILARIVKRGALLVRALGLPVLVEKVKRSRASKVLYVKSSYDVVNVCGDNLQTYVDYFREDVHNMSSILEVDLEKLWFDKYKGVDIPK
ncbi:MAG: sulfotransferase domain-containing protein [Pseudohongiellaceae bacterium]|nr:sulfotransferase domain-containing protein [Pseudohongiellaceae bacterium]